MANPSDWLGTFQGSGSDGSGTFSMGDANYYMAKDQAQAQAWQSQYGGSFGQAGMNYQSTTGGDIAGQQGYNSGYFWTPGTGSTASDATWALGNLEGYKKGEDSWFDKLIQGVTVAGGLFTGAAAGGLVGGAEMAGGAGTYTAGSLGADAAAGGYSAGSMLALAGTAAPGAAGVAGFGELGSGFSAAGVDLGTTGSLTGGMSGVAAEGTGAGVAGAGALSGAGGLAGGGVSALSGLTAGSGGAGLGSLFDLAKGGLGLLGAASMSGSGSGANLADPFASQRPQYQAMLSQLMQNPSAVLPTTPGYQAGMDAVQRSMAAQGYQGSGNMMAAMQQYGGNIFNQEATLLSGLAGANSGSPAAAGQLAQSQQTNMINLAGQAVNTIGNAAVKAWG